MDGGLTTIFDASTDVQDGAGGDDFPIEFIGGGAFGGERLLIDKFAAGTTSSVPAFNLILLRGELDDALATSGATRGHSAAANSISVAATPAAASFDGVTPDGPFPGLFTAANESESFTSDGPRRILLTTDRRRDHAGQPHRLRRRRPPEARHHGRRRRFHRRAGLQPFLRHLGRGAARRRHRRPSQVGPARPDAGTGSHRPGQLGDRHRGPRSRP